MCSRFNPVVINNWRGSESDGAYDIRISNSFLCSHADLYCCTDSLRSCTQLLHKLLCMFIRPTPNTDLHISSSSLSLVLVPLSWTTDSEECLWEWQKAIDHIADVQDNGLMWLTSVWSCQTGEWPSTVAKDHWSQWLAWVTSLEWMNGTDDVEQKSKIK